MGNWRIEQCRRTLSLRLARTVFSVLLVGFCGVSFAQERATSLTSADLDRLFQSAAKLDDSDLADLITDEQFLRRVTLDLIGRQPTPAELATFLLDSSTSKRTEATDRLLNSPEFGSNWAGYWSDVIGYRVPPPELTFLDYTLFEQWLAGRINQNAPWDETVRLILMASGKVKEHPEATFVGFHQADTTRLAAETARVFMSLQIGCAQCHDHPFDEWKREQFHELAAYFVRASAKMPWNDSGEIEVKDKGKGEYVMPNVADPTKKGTTMIPTFLTGSKLESGKSDLERRTELASVVASNTNPWFAKAYVNRVWARLMGRGFCEPVDDIGAGNEPQLREVQQPLTDSFIASGFDAKGLFRVIVNSKAYQQRLADNPSTAEKPFAAGRTTKLRGDEVFQSLVTAIELPNVTPAKIAPTKEIRFPPPPKSTRDVVSEVFGFDPSLRPEDISRTLGQAMLLMNNDQLQAQINSRPESGTALSKLLAGETDNSRAVSQLFQLVLARKPNDAEVQLALDHVSSLPIRGEAFEDLLWSLINSAEFTTKR
ncbi:MAG: DUF1549 domain-containing protein [Planctomycetes bacterium]|nr:DUF1549 domain-containing protein [Planctomycetota bacterium]